MTKKILYISYDGMTDPLGQSQVLPYLRELSKQGYDFHLVSFEKHERYIQHKDHISQICRDANIQWHPQDYALQGGLKKTWKQVRRMKNVVNRLHQKHSFDMTHCRSYISALAGLELKNKKNVKMVFDMRGFWADERLDGRLWNLKNPVYNKIYKYFKKKELHFFNQSDYTISLTQNGKDEIESWEKIDKNIQIEVIPCCVDLELFDPSKINVEDQNKLKSELNISETDYILGYVGSIGTWYMLPEMLKYFSHLKQSNPKAKFLFVTGENSDSIFSAAKEFDIEMGDLIITKCLHKDVPLHLSLFNQSIFFIRPTYSKKASSPTKQGEIMAMGVPLICNSGVGDTDAVVKKYKAGLILEELNDESFRKSLKEELIYNSSEITQGAKDFFSLEEGVKRYLKVYETVMNGK